jgi:NAD(P)H dehydrogenase (quinone)
MKVFWVFAHPEPRSLSGALRDAGVAALREQGHEYRMSDLYAMGWDPVVTGDDFGAPAADRLLGASASKTAYRAGALRADIAAEQEKLRWADTVIIQFPLWWYGMPAILKGWFDRVFVKDFAYGVRDADTGRTLVYGNGGLVGRRAMVITTIGAPGPSIGPRGIHGHLDELLFGLQHGTLFYTGMAVVPPVAVPSADRLGAAEYERVAGYLRQRLADLPTTEPIAFRHRDSGDYDDDLVLRPDRSPDAGGLLMHAHRCMPMPPRRGSPPAPVVPTALAPPK